MFKARHAESKDIVAIKMLPEDAYSFYSREAQVLRQLQPCPYIMSIIDAFVDQEGLCIVMPYIEHGSLQTYMNKLHGDPLELGQTISLLEELLLGISHAHSRDVIHRDVKLQNILLGNATDGILTDFGIAYAMESTGRTTTMMAELPGISLPRLLRKSSTARSTCTPSASSSTRCWAGSSRSISRPCPPTPIRISSRSSAGPPPIAPNAIRHRMKCWRIFVLWARRWSARRFSPLPSPAKSGCWSRRRTPVGPSWNRHWQSAS